MGILGFLLAWAHSANVVDRLASTAGYALLDAAFSAFTAGFSVMALAAAAVAFVGSLAVVWFMPEEAGSRRLQDAELGLSAAPTTVPG